MFAGASPITPPPLRQKHTRSKGASLCRHYPASTVLSPFPIPARAATRGDVEAATLARDGPPPITRITFLACRAHYPGGPERVHSSVTPPFHAAFPLISGGSASTSSLSRPAQASLAFGPQGRSTAQGGLCHRASVPPVTRQDRLSATRSNRQLSGWILPPLVLRAVGAH